MELAGIAAGGNMRSIFSECEIKSAIELEAHINMNAMAARLNFEKYCALKASVPLPRHAMRTRLGYDHILEGPSFLLNVGTSRFDYGTIGQLYHDKLEEKVKNSDARKAAKEAGEGVDLLVSVKANMDDPFKLVITGCDYTNVDKVVNNLKGNTEVTHLSLANNGLEADDCDALATLIRENKTIVSLDLSNNKLGGEGIAKLAPALAENRTLTDLDLGANNLGISGAKALAGVLSSLSKLERLRLSGNALGIYGAEELAIGLKANRSIKALGLQNNNLGNDGATKLLDVLPRMSMLVGGTSLFTDCAVDDARLDHCAADLTERNSCLQVLAVDGNRIDDDLLQSLERCLDVSRNLAALLALEEIEASARAVVAHEEIDAWGRLLLMNLTEATAAQERMEIRFSRAKAAEPPRKDKPKPPAKGATKGTATKRAASKPTTALKPPPKKVECVPQSSVQALPPLSSRWEQQRAEPLPSEPPRGRYLSFSRDEATPPPPSRSTGRK